MTGPFSGYELHNLHDLGGLITPSGAIRTRRLFRSANPDSLTVNGWQQLLDAGVRTLVDLRNEDERVSTVRPDALRVERHPIEDQTDTEFMGVWGNRLGSPEYYPEVTRRWPRLVAAAVAAIADAPEGGVLIHCMAGRDRTGMITAILLELVGVDREAIFADFAQSAREINDWWRIHGGPKGSQSDGELAAYLLEAKSTLNAFLDELDTIAYLHNAGVSQEQLHRLRSRLVDP